MKPENPDVPDMLDATRFARQHPQLDQALRAQIGAKAPVADAAFRRQVMARIAASRAELRLAANEPERMRRRLKTQFLLQLANIAGLGIAAALLVGLFWPGVLATLSTSGSISPLWNWLHQNAGLPMLVAMSVGALAFGLYRAGMLDRLRAFDL